MMAIDWHRYLSWMYTGVDFTIPGNGGDSCVNFLPNNQRIIETVAFLLLSVMEMVSAWPRLKLPDRVPVTRRGYDRTGKRVLLLLHTLFFGIELGFKFSTRSMIWLLNPCHLVTMMQIYLLVAPPTKFTMLVFRIHLHCLTGATIALLFPVVNTRSLPFETEVYYIQHILMLVIPYCLMRLGGVYTTEKLPEFQWPLFALGFLFFYHFTVMQGLSLLTGINLNNMMCPAISDPFYGRWYRLCAVVHQSIMIMVHGKIYTFFAQKYLPKNALPREEETPVLPPSGSSKPLSETSGDLRNGHIKRQ